MTSQTVDGACAFAWRNYLLLHSGISENDKPFIATSPTSVIPAKTVSISCK